jgi:hypothetical protein
LVVGERRDGWVVAVAVGGKDLVETICPTKRRFIRHRRHVFL